VFGIVLVEQLGLPIPAFPILIIAGAMAVDNGTNWPLYLAAAVLACLMSDFFWFRAGRFYGKRILRLLCKISLSPDSCVSQTEDNFGRWGAKSLIVAKFIPGFSTIVSPLAGATGTRTSHFWRSRRPAACCGVVSAWASAPGSTTASTTSSPGSRRSAAPR
jgi:membrane protein DedA with SNARE-associated domain